MQPEIISGMTGYTNYIASPTKGAPAKMVIAGCSPQITNQTQNYFNRNTSEQDLTKQFGLNIEKVNVKANKKEIDIFQLFTNRDMETMPKEDVLWVIS